MSYITGGPTGQVYAVTKSDTVPARGSATRPTIFDWLRVDVGGTLTIEKPDETTIQITALAGEYVPIRGTHVHATGTAATGIVAGFPDAHYEYE